MEITLPVNSEGEVNLPLSGIKKPVVKERGKVVYQDDSYVQGVSGIVAGKRNEGHIIFSVGSGTYSFWIGESP